MPENNHVIGNEEIFEVLFKVRVSVFPDEIITLRKGNRLMQTSNFYARDINIAQPIAYDKALERVKKQLDIQYGIHNITESDLNTTL